MNLRRFVASVVFGFFALSIYQVVYEKWLWTPDAPVRKEIQRFIARISKVAATEVRNTAEPVARKQESEQKYDAAATRNVALDAARKARSLNETYRDANAIAAGARTDGISEAIVPPPPPPPPPPPFHTRLSTLSLSGELFLKSTTNWISFRSQTSTWLGPKETVNVGFFGPLRVRASGHLEGMGRSRRPVSSTPNGISPQEQQDGYWETYRSNGGSREDYTLKLAVPYAPYLALIARVCDVVDHIQERINSPYSRDLVATNLRCTEPFLVGSDAVLCPDKIGRTGEVQFLINELFARSIHSPQSGNFQGGYYIQTEPASSAPCAATSPETIHEEAKAIAAGTLINVSDNRISSRQGNWRPINVQPGQPFYIKAWGQMQPREQHPYIADPNGYDYRHNLARFDDPYGGVAGRTGKEYYAASRNGDYIYPARLVLPQANYLALLGRFCVGNNCSKPFFIGSECLICPPTPQHFVELIPNYRLPLTGEEILGAKPTMEGPAYFRGEFRFQVTAASHSQCKYHEGSR